MDLKLKNRQKSWAIVVIAMTHYILMHHEVKKVIRSKHPIIRK